MNLIFYDLHGVLMEVYIDDVVVKSVSFKEHMTNLKLSLERMKEVWTADELIEVCLRGNIGKVHGVVVHEHSIHIDPKKIESIGKIGEPVRKRDVQKLLGKINNLHHFISNLAGRVEFFLPLIRLKHEEEFTWGRNREKILRRSKNISCLHPCCKLRRPGTCSRCILLRKNRLLELFYYKKKMATSF
jgi:hypothetical protein